MEVLFEYVELALTLGALFVAAIGYVVRLELLAKSNTKRLEALEERLSAEVTNEWVAFKAVTESTLKNQGRQITDLFTLHNTEHIKPVRSARRDDD